MPPLPLDPTSATAAAERAAERVATPEGLFAYLARHAAADAAFLREIAERETAAERRETLRGDL